MRDATPDDGPTQSLVALREAIDSPLNGASVVADAYHTCRFSELRPLISGIQSHLAEHDVQPGDCVVLELANAVPSALLALSCLDAGLSVMLVPMEGLGARVAGSNFEAPRFCRFIATVRDGLRSGPRRLDAARDLHRRAPQPELRPRERCGSRARPTVLAHVGQPRRTEARGLVPRELLDERSPRTRAARAPSCAPRCVARPDLPRLRFRRRVLELHVRRCVGRSTGSVQSAALSRERAAVRSQRRIRDAFVLRDPHARSARAATRTNSCSRAVIGSVNRLSFGPRRSMGR